jgi:hypothetical protein
MFFLAEKLGKTISEIESSITQSEFIAWNVYFDPKSWENKILNSTQESRDNAIMNLIIGQSNG